MFGSFSSNFANQGTATTTSTVERLDDSTPLSPRETGGEQLNYATLKRRPDKAGAEMNATDAAAAEAAAAAALEDEDSHEFELLDINDDDILDELEPDAPPPPEPVSDEGNCHNLPFALRIL